MKRIPWRKVILQTLTVVQMVKKSPIVLFVIIPDPSSYPITYGTY
jgi:hypothetical protein